MDTIIQALSGLMMTSGEPGDGPVRVGVPVADMVAPLFGVIGILAALQQRERTGAGQHVDVSMLGALTSMVAGRAVRPARSDAASRSGRDGWCRGSRPSASTALATGGWRSAHRRSRSHAGSSQRWAEPELAADPRFETRDARVAHVDELNGLVETFTAASTLCRSGSSLFDRHGVPAAEVRSPREAVRDPRVRATWRNGSARASEHGRVDDMVGMGVPIMFSGAAPRVSIVQRPRMGEHNDSRLWRAARLFAAKRIAALARRWRHLGAGRGRRDRGARVSDAASAISTLTSCVRAAARTTRTAQACTLVSRVIAASAAHTVPSEMLRAAVLLSGAQVRPPGTDAARCDEFLEPGRLHVRAFAPRSSRRSAGDLALPARARLPAARPSRTTRPICICARAAARTGTRSACRRCGSTTCCIRDRLTRPTTAWRGPASWPPGSKPLAGRPIRDADLDGGRSNEANAARAAARRLSRCAGTRRASRAPRPWRSPGRSLV